MRLSVTILLMVSGVLASPAARAQSAAGASPRNVVESLRALAQEGTRSVVLDAAGLTRSGRRIWALEPGAAVDPSKPKLVLVAGLDERASGTAVALELLRWWFTAPAAAPLRQRWQVAALPCARPDACGDAPVAPPDGRLVFPPSGGFFDGKLEPTPHYVWRWVTM